MYLGKTDLPYLIGAIEGLNLQENETVMLLFPEEEHPDIPMLLEALNARGIPVFGGLFPGLIFGNCRLSKGCILKKFRTAVPPFTVLDVSEGDFSGLGAIRMSTVEHRRTALILVDGLTSGIYYFLEALNDLFGMDVNFMGAGAGSLSLRQDRCVFSNEGFFQDAAVVCILEKTSRLGVRHGWKKIAGPMVATHTDGNTIMQLNWQKAMEVYSAVVGADCGRVLTKDNFFDISQAYPFGIFREKEDDIVRDPIAAGDNGEIICIGEVPANTVLYILKGDKDTLLEATRQAVSDCKEPGIEQIVAEDTLVVDCISRTLFLGDSFPEELKAVRNQLQIDTEEQEPQGVLSLGEISSYSQGVLELFNKTIVVGTFTTA